MDSWIGTETSRTVTGTEVGTYCDKCGRPISSGKGYLIINGWIICGICQYEDEQKKEKK